MPSYRDDHDFCPWCREFEWATYRQLDTKRRRAARPTLPASNLRSTEIAAELFGSSNTVRTHLRHIYAKLDAHSRTEAVARGRQLGLLAPVSRLG